MTMHRSAGYDLMHTLSSMCIAPHICRRPQTRLLALEVCDVFFTRSQAFRGHLSQHFSSFMAATVGHQQDQPLPGPAAVAVTLRTKALAAIERWQQQWGQYYPQVSGFACSPHTHLLAAFSALHPSSSSDTY